MIEEIATNSEEQYQEALSELRALLRRHHPLLVLSQMSFYGLSVAVNETTGLTKLDSDHQMFPYHVEILQGLLLQIPPDELSSKPLGPQVLTQVWGQVQTLCDAHNFRQFDPGGALLRDDQMAVALVQEFMRGATRAVRNWGYHAQVKRIARELYCPFDAQLLEARGFSASDILDVFETMVTQVEYRQTHHLHTLADLFRSSGTNGRALVYNYHELIGLAEEKAEQFVKDLNVENMPLDQIRTMIIAHYDLRLLEVYTFLLADLAAMLNLDKDRVSAILDEYALDLGALGDYETDHLHLSTPVREKPLVKLRSGEFFCALPATFFSFVIPCMEAVLTPFAAEVSKHRAEYLESKVSEIVERRFRSAHIKRNFKWVDDGKTYEIRPDCVHRLVCLSDRMQVRKGNAARAAGCARSVAQAHSRASNRTQSAIIAVQEAHSVSWFPAERRRFHS